MATFLNREGILKHFSRLFDEAKSEIVMVVPFIKLTNEITEKLKLAHAKGIEILIIYRENELNHEQKRILFAFDNVTVLHHPNVHAKCYLNERSLIICSMNLYETSMKNNREMGVLLDYFNEELEPKKAFNASDDSEPIEDAIEELRTILNSSTIEKQSDKVKLNGFKFNLLKNNDDIVIDLIADLNKLLGNKKFTQKRDENGKRIIYCPNYFENVDIELDIRKYFNELNVKTAFIHTLNIRLLHPEEQIKRLHESFGKQIEEYRYKFYKTYWNWHGGPIKIYRDRKKFKQVWEKGNDLEHIKGLLKGADKVLNDLKKEKLFTKIV